MATKPNGIIYHVDSAKLTDTNNELLALDFEDSAHGIGIDLPDGWYTDNANGKIEVNSGKVYGLKTNSNVIELEQNAGDASNLYTMVDTQPNQALQISFDAAQRAGFVSGFSLVVDGAVIETIVPEDNHSFAHHEFTVATTGEEMKIEFVATGSFSQNGHGAVLDNIEITSHYSDNLIVNGSFEDTTGMDKTSYGYADAGGQIVGWNTDPTDQIELHNNGRGGQIATDGENWLDLDSTPGNIRIGQDVQGIVDGVAYQLSMDLSDSKDLPYEGSNENMVNVYWGGELIATIDPSNYRESEFATSSLRLVGGAGDGSNRLEFEGTGKEDKYGAAVDNVRLYAIEPAIPVNQSPEATDDTATGTQDTTLTIAIADLLANDSDPDGDNLYDFSVQSAVNGSVTIVGDNIEFYPDADYTGPASFTYSITDGKGGFDTATVNLTIEATANLAPVVNGETFESDLDTAISTTIATLLANDSDPEGETLSITSVQDAVNGTVEIVDDAVVFTPAAGYAGPASYTYTVSDGVNASVATVNLTINAPANQAPIALDDTAAGTENTPLVIQVADLLANDSDPDGDEILEFSIQDAVNGTVTFENGEITFTPAAGHTGPASFTYTITDSRGGFSTATVNLTIEAEVVDPVNQAPVVTGEAFESIQGAAVSTAIAELLANDTDPENDTLSITSVQNAENGTVAIVNDEVVFTPDAEYVGDASYTYTVSDGVNESIATVNLTITAEVVDPVNQAPVAVDDTIAPTGVDQLVTITPAEILGNDYDPEGGEVIGVDLNNPVNGIVYYENGNVFFLPATGHTGPASFDYVIQDSQGLESTGTVNLSISADVGTPNQAPVAEDDTIDPTIINELITIAPADILANDSDPDGDNFTIVDLNTAVNGVVYNEGGNIVFLPTDDYTGPASFDYVIQDADGLESTGTVNLTIQALPEINGTEEADTLNGTEASETINGLAGDDTIVAGAGDDVLVGGLGSDTLEGGAGADTYAWSLADIATDEVATDTLIADFDDRIDLRDLLVDEELVADATAAEALDAYMNFSVDADGDTIIEISSTGDVDNEVEQIIEIAGYDATAGGTLSDVEILNNLMTGGHLITDA